MNIIEMDWPKVEGGGNLLQAVLSSDDTTCLHFVTGTTLGTKSGYVACYTGNTSGTWTALWPFSGALNFTPGDLTTNIAPEGIPSTVFANADGPNVFYRGVASQPHQSPMLALLPDTDYYFNLFPIRGCPNPLIGVRFSLVAPRA